jgi:hypothetical protein
MIRTAFVAALAAAGLTGCAQIDTYAVRDEQAVQSDLIGDVVALRGTFCLDDQSTPAPRAASLVVGPGGDGVCDPAGSLPGLPQGLADDGGAQFFAAFLVPDTAVEPATATAQLPAAFDGATVTLKRKRSLDETLEHTRPAAAGLRWVGYISPVVGAAATFKDTNLVAAHLLHASETPLGAPADPATGDWSAEADFRAGRGEGGFPVPTRFGHAVIGGTRLAYPEALYDGVDATAPGVADADRFGLQLLDTRPVDCQELREFPYTQLFAQSLQALAEAPSGLPLLPTTLCGRPSGEAALALKDLRGSGGVVPVAPGGTATVPFTLRYAGEPGPTFALSATSAVPGATATPSTPALTPAAAGFHDVGIAVAVPAGTPSGDYAVTLIATVGGQVRTAVGMLSVTAPAATGSTTGQDPGTVGGAGTPVTVPARSRYVEFRGFDRTGLGPDGKSINLGDVLCHKTAGACGFVRVQLSVRWEQLHDGAEVARAAASVRVRMVVIGTTSLSVPAGGRRRVRVTVPARVRRMLQRDEVLHAIVGVRAAHNVLPIVQRVTLRRG